MTIFESDVLEDRRRRAAEAFGNQAPTVLIGAGEPISIPGGLDQTYPFTAHPEYYWLTGSQRSGGVLAYSQEAGWTHFVRPVTPTERLWEGNPDAPEGEDVAGLSEWLKRCEGAKTAVLGSPIPGVERDDELATDMRVRLDAVRRRKDSAEVELLGRAVKATAAGFAKAREVIQPGISERQIQIELEAEMFRQGADAVGFGTIVGVGSNAAVLHFEPGDRIVKSDDLVLIDAGGAISGYTADVTRTYPAEDRFTPKQQDIYDLVLAAESEGISKCCVGTEWHDVHRAAASILAQGLRDFGILKGEIDGLLDSGAIALFFPHGIGHMTGLGVRDVGGHTQGRGEVRSCCGVRVRIDFPLGENFLMTVEPGIYFVPAILDDPAKRDRFRESVAWESLDAWRSVGGVRIEDNVLITSSGPRVITAEIPK
ncbi:MAG: aminopeptidase P family protein [Candidatus Poribacteria bacterium]|nr:aminopeptidase P family protein [Candidatus Poribacteria bacterium]MDE0505707.1 aminopeptidase P family protein [Candidatus Poribacteria bacterium]